MVVNPFIGIRRINSSDEHPNAEKLSAIIIAKGEVQGVGYRGKVFKIEEDPILVEEVDVTFEEPTGEFEYFFSQGFYRR